MQPAYGYGGQPQYTPQPPAYSRVLVVGLLAVAAFGLSLFATWMVHAIDLVEFDAIEARTIPRWVAPAESLLLACAQFIRLLGIVPFMMWVHGASSNARALGGHTTITPGWAVGWFFIPVASLYMPYKAMREIASCSDPRGAAIVPASLSVWWFLFIASGIGRAVASVVKAANDLGLFITLQLLVTTIATGALVALAMLVMTIHRGQEFQSRTTSPKSPASVAA